MDINWVNGFRISVSISDNTVTLSANREGLLSLARQLMDLSQEETGTHIHYDEHNSLDDGSKDLIIERIE